METTEFDSNSERDKAVLAIVNRYKKHPYVQKEGEKYRNSYRPSIPPTDALGRYLQEITQYDFLTENDEYELFSNIEKGVSLYQNVQSFDGLTPEQEKILMDTAAAYQAVYKSNLPLVVSIAKNYWSLDMLSKLDMIQEGNIGLSIGVRRFDVSKGFKFSTFATGWIRQSIVRAIGNTGRTIRMPIHIGLQYQKVRRANSTLFQTLGRDPTDKEIAEASGVKLEIIEEFRGKGALRPLSLEAPAGEGGDAKFGDFIHDPNGIDTEIDAISDQTEIAKIFASSRLPPCSLVILCLRWCVYVEDLREFTTPNGHTYDDMMKQVVATKGKGLALERIGKLFGLPPTRVGQLEKEALNTLYEVSQVSSS